MKMKQTKTVHTFSRSTFQFLYEDILEEAEVAKKRKKRKKRKVAKKRIIFLKLEEYAHICSQSEILACPNIDQRGICHLAAPAPADNEDGDDGQNDSEDGQPKRQRLTVMK